MKNLKNLGKVLSSKEQKSVNGGQATYMKHCYCDLNWEAMGCSSCIPRQMY